MRVGHRVWLLKAGREGRQGNYREEETLVEGEENRKLLFSDCYSLTKLPYFDLNEKGVLTLTQEGLPPIVDFHTHLALTWQFSPQVDLNKRTPRVLHFFRERHVRIDMNIYSGINLKNERREGMFKEYVDGAFSNKGAVSTFTVPNILAEMDRMGIEHSVLLAVDTPGSRHVSKSYAESTQNEPRLITFCGVNPRSRRWEEHVEKAVEDGARGLKIHPYMMFFPPNHKKVMRLIRKWGETGYPILFHTAHNGLEPSFLRNLSDIELYRKPLEKFPDITFILGHAGMGFFREAAELARNHGNTYLEIGGQPPDDLKRIIDLMGEDKVLFGSDWPFYPFALPLAKALIATEDAPGVRRKILSENAYRLIGDLCLV